MEPVSLLRVFIASPGDVEKERKAVRDACALVNLELGDYLKVRLEAIGWENYVIPSYGEEAQKVVFEQVGLDRMDLFVGILCNRFGGDRHRESGTIQEFGEAAELWRARKRPHLMLYFGDKEVGDTAEAREQRQKVVAFRESLEHTIYQQYRGTSTQPAEDVFAGLFHTHLSMWLTRTAPPPPRSAEIPEEFKIIHLTISDFEWYHLLQLWKSGAAQGQHGHPHPYRPADSLEAEMRRLERAQLIRFKNQVTRWQRLPTSGEFMLPDHVELTDFGRQFIDWRRQIPPYGEVW